MKLNKMTIYSYDSNEDIDDTNETIGAILDDKYSLYFSIKCFEKETVDVGEWDDDIDLNNINCPQEVFEKYFIEGKTSNKNIQNLYADCPHCGEQHEVSNGKQKQEDGTWKESNLLQTITCPKSNKCYLIGFKGRKLK